MWNLVISYKNFHIWKSSHIWSYTIHIWKTKFHIWNPFNTEIWQFHIRIFIYENQVIYEVIQFTYEKKHFHLWNPFHMWKLVISYKNFHIWKSSHIWSHTIHIWKTKFHIWNPFHMWNLVISIHIRIFIYENQVIYEIIQFTYEKGNFTYENHFICWILVISYVNFHIWKSSRIFHIWNYTFHIWQIK